MLEITLEGFGGGEADAILLKAKFKVSIAPRSSGDSARELCASGRRRNRNPLRDETYFGGSGG